jgi:hypothetical protein
MREGWWNMACWEGLSAAQQAMLIERGTLSLGYRPEGDCQEPASVCIETEHDAAPGPRFYCWNCGIAYLENLQVFPRPDVSHT